MSIDNGNARGILILLLVCLPATLLLGLTALYPPYELSPAAQGCRMSWMSPSYILQQPHLNTSWAVAGRYRLWLYREVGWDGDKPSGAPVLFIPGNAGSFKQVRSMASSATRQYWTEPYARSHDFPSSARPLDFFALDVNEELSAWDAATLAAQASFAAAAVPYILSLYAHQADPPRDVLIIGHSMGGIVARTMLDQTPRPAVTTVFSLSTPHAFPPLPISRSLERIYKPGPVPDGILFLSLCGGSQDVEFPAEMCSHWEGSNVNWTRWATGIEQVWTGVGHREMVWCHQVRWRVARAALEMASLRSLAQKEVITERWFGTTRPEQYPHYSSPDSGELSAIEGQSFFIDQPFLSRRYVFPGGRDQSDIVVLHPMTLRLEPQVCTSLDSCERALVTYRRLLPLPPRDQPFPRPGEGIGEEEAIVVATVRPEPGRQLMIRMVDGSGWLAGEPADSKLVEDVSAMWKALTLGVSVSLPSDTRRAIHTTFRFAKLQEAALLVYRVSLDLPVDCAQTRISPILSSQSSESFFHPSAVSSPSYFTSHASSAPFMPERLSHLTIEIWNPTKCEIKGLSVHLDVWASLGRAFGRYRVVLVAWSLGVTGILSVIAYAAWDAGAPFPSVTQALFYYVRHTIPVLSIILVVVSLLPLPQQWLLGNSGLPYLAPIGPVLLLASTFLVALSWLILRLLLSLIAGGMRLLRLQTRTTLNTRLGLSHYLSIGVFCLLLVLFVPSHFVFLVAFLVQFVTAARSLHMLWEAPSSRAKASLTEAHFAQCSHLLLMLFWLLPLTAPFAIVWIRTLVSRGLSALLTNDYDLLAVACVVLSIESASAGRVSSRSNSPWQKWGTRALLIALCSYCFLLGGRYTYGIYEWVELYFCATLIRPSKRGLSSDATSEGTES